MARNKLRKPAKGSPGQNRKNSESFIQKYGRKEGVSCTPEGVLYRIIDQGRGVSPCIEDTVRVHQRVLLSDGTVIADTYRTGEIETFSLSEAIDGLKIAIPMMSTLARYEFVIPPDLAWGKRGAGNKIGANAVLVFDIKLLEILIQ